MDATATTSETDAPPARVDLRAEFNEVGIGEVLDQLDRELIGLKPVKTRIREIAALLLVERLRKQMGLATGNPTLHMSFTGNPGTGKTTVAMKMAQILHRLGYIEEPRVVACTRDDLVGQFIGHRIEGKKPSFFQDLSFLLIGPAWLMSFDYRRLGQRY